MIAVTGATGFVGQALLDAATEHGIAVRALTRKPQPLRDGVTWVPGDLANTAALKTLLQGAEAVIHVAGVTTAPDLAGFETGNVAGTLNVIEAALAAGGMRCVFVSSLSAREPQLSQYGASKARAEKLVKASGLDWTIVRPPSIYGPRDVDSFLDLFRIAAWGVVPVPPAGHSSIIHVDDLSQLLLDLIPGSEAVTHHTFEPDDGKSGGWSHQDLARAIGGAVGRQPKVLHLKRAWMERAARLDMRFRGSRAKLTLDRVGYMTHPDWVVSATARVPDTLWVPRIDTHDGMKATAAWYRSTGCL
jgi:nucleoside-diphosphate-sugar epimerase